MTFAALGSSRRPPLIAVCLLALVLTGCTGRGGGQLPTDLVHNGSASFGFSFSCEDKGGINPQTGQLRIQLSYTERSTRSLPLPPLSPFSIHGVVDEVDQVEESMLCNGQEPPPGGHTLIFLGRYRLTSPSQGFPAACSGSEITTSSCRFEVIVQDGDGNLAPSGGDEFSIRLTSVTSTTSSVATDCPPEAELPCYVTEFPDSSVLYARAGTLSSGNLTVD